MNKFYPIVHYIAKNVEVSFNLLFSIPKKMLCILNITYKLAWSPIPMWYWGYGAEGRGRVDHSIFSLLKLYKY